jgi:hypothetical protein
MGLSHRSWLLWQSHPAIELILIAIGVKTEYRSVSRSLSESEMMDLLRLLKLFWQPDLFMLAIGVLKESPMPRSPLRAR